VWKMAEDLKLHDRTILEQVWSKQPEHFQRIKRVRKHNRRTQQKRRRQRDRVSVAEVESS